MDDIVGFIALGKFLGTVSGEWGVTNSKKHCVNS
jgi:hypothetical protein